MTFVNLTNGIEIFNYTDLCFNKVRFIRIQSTACEQKRWEQILLDLSPDFYLLSALGKSIMVYDFGANKKTSRAIWQGLEWIKFVLHKRWLNIDYTPTGRAKSMKHYFNEQYHKLDKKTKALLDYYGKFSVGKLDIIGVSSETNKDSNYEYYKNILLKVANAGNNEILSRL